MMSETDKLEEAVHASTEAPEAELHDHDESQELVDLYTQSLREIAEGEIVKGTVVEIRNDTVLIDIGYKSEGAVPIKEFQAPSGEITVKVGDTVDVYLEQKEDADGLIVLSREKAEKTKIWE
ncbi:MAG: 30S ribosomal protein S1, partial [Candidatus Methylomirabilota bacterium]